MYDERKAMWILVISVMIFLLHTNSMFNVFGEPALLISPSCGPAKPGFNIQVNATGFRPNTQVDWKLISSDNQIPTYGYFQSNKTGGVSDVVFVGDLNDGHYKMYFGIDPDADGKMDTKSPMIYANISMPCPQ